MVSNTLGQFQQDPNALLRLRVAGAWIILSGLQHLLMLNPALVVKEQAKSKETSAKPATSARAAGLRS